MPDLDFTVTGVEPAFRGLTPLLHFKLKITSDPAAAIHSVILQAQIQIQSPRRSYSTKEKRDLVELFGSPDRWGETLRTMLWSHANTTVGPFSGATETILPVPCTYDFNVAGTKYFYSLEGGDVPLLFLFSGTIFHEAADGRLQVQRISWEKECAWQMPVRRWQELMDSHYPNSAWLCLRRDAFERLYRFKSREGLMTWEQAIERLLPRDAEPGSPAL